MTDTELDIIHSGNVALVQACVTLKVSPLAKTCIIQLTLLAFICVCHAMCWLLGSKCIKRHSKQSLCMSASVPQQNYQLSVGSNL